MKWSDFDPYLAAKHFAGKPTATLTIDQVVIEEVYSPAKRANVRVPVLYFKETKKGLILSPTNQDKLEALFGDDISACHGQRITLEIDPMRVAGRDLQVIRVAAKAPPKSNGDSHPPANPEPAA